MLVVADQVLAVALVALLVVAGASVGVVAVVRRTAQAMHSRVRATATAAFFSLPLPNRRARRRNRAPGRVAVRQVAQAAPAMAVRRCTPPLRVGALLRLPSQAPTVPPHTATALSVLLGCLVRRFLLPRACAGLFAACDEVLHAPHGEERGDDGDQDGRGLQRPHLGHERGQQHH